MKDPSSICAGGEWWAAYHNPEGAEFHRVVVFAVRRDPHDAEALKLDGFDTADLHEQGQSYCSDHLNFRGFFHSDEFSDLGKRLKLTAHDRFTRGVR